MEEVEVEIQQCKEAIARRDVMVRLRNNKDFQEIIEIGYLKEEAVRLIMAKVAGLPAEAMDKLDKLAYGPGALAQHFDTILRLGDQAEQALNNNELTREELLTEDVA
jgi:hypothetical protein